MKSVLRTKIARQLIFFAVIVVGWELLFRLKLWPPYIFPSPFAVGSSLIGGILDGAYPIGIGVSMTRILIGFALSIAIGLPLGLLIGRVAFLSDTFGSVLNGLQTLPSICWRPLALIWFGLNESAILFVVVMGAVLSIAIAAEGGVKNTPPQYLRAAHNLGARGWRLYRHVIFPAALPSILTGLRLGWSFAWRSLMAGELIYITLGLGQLLAMRRDLNDLSQVMAVMLVIIALGLTVDRAVFSPLERNVRQRWGLSPR
ncbi:MAG: ABC transporter permease [Chloroflexi bacterium]|nr:ABC transporter permease [Chloroflexota bacterium]